LCTVASKSCGFSANPVPTCSRKTARDIFWVLSGTDVYRMLVGEQGSFAEVPELASRQARAISSHCGPDRLQFEVARCNVIHCGSCDTVYSIPRTPVLPISRCVRSPAVFFEVPLEPVPNAYSQFFVRTEAVDALSHVAPSLN
jgi:hypothetical protein